MRTSMVRKQRLYVEQSVSSIALPLRRDAEGVCPLSQARMDIRSISNTVARHSGLTFRREQR